MDFGDDIWPLVTPACRICGGKAPSHRYRTRGLCTRCYLVACKEKTLWQYPLIPDELKDTTYYALLRDPRRYVGEVYSKPYADGIDDEQILEEAKRLFDISRLRWLGVEAHVVDPRPKSEDVVWGSMSMTEPEPYDPPEEVQTSYERVKRHRRRLRFMAAKGKDLISNLAELGTGIPFMAADCKVVRGDLCWNLLWGGEDASVLLKVPDSEDSDPVVTTTIAGRAYESDFSSYLFMSHVQRLRVAMKGA